MKHPTEQSIDNTLSHLKEWGEYYGELVELEIQLCELRRALFERESGQERDKHLIQEVKRNLHVLRYRIEELKAKLV